MRRVRANHHTHEQGLVFNRMLVRTPRAMRQMTTTLLLIGITINYVDRQVLSVLAPTLRKELGISSLEYSYILNSFLVVYAAMYAVAGRIIDLVGTRHGLGVAVIWWSAAEMLHGLANGAVTLCILRALLAVGEAAIIPSSVKAVAEWFSAGQRAMVISIVEIGLSLGPIISPPLVVWIAMRQGWRYAFFWTGVAGFLWAVPWWLLYRTPHEMSREVQEEDSAWAGRDAVEWTEILRSPAVWAMGLGRFFGDPVWYFYLFWLPKYLSEIKGLSLQSLGALAWIPYCSALLGGLSGGAASSWMIKRGAAAATARKQVMLLSSVAVAAGVLSIFCKEVFWVLFVISAALFGMLSWGVNLDALPTDLFPPEQVAEVMGLCGLFGSLGGILFTAATGYVVQRFSYSPIWIASGLMYPVGYLVLSVLLGQASNFSRSETRER